METEKDNLILIRKGVKPTANRILVLRALLSAARPVSLSELEDMLLTMDRSSIFRVLNCFLAHHVTHALEDGSGIMKFEVCTGEWACSVDDMHTHFYCEICQQTFCFKEIHVPLITLPEGFVLNSINYMVKGICPECARKLAVRRQEI